MSLDRVAHKFPLLDAALRGTAQYAHLISVDFFGDLMAELLRLLRAPGLPLRIRLQVLLTASDILRCARRPQHPAQVPMQGSVYAGAMNPRHTTVKDI